MPYEEVVVDNSNGCCGNDEIYELASAAKDNVIAVCLERYESEHTTAFYTFADALVYKNGSRLAAYIRKQKLGNVLETKPKVNPNSKRKIKVWIWDVDDKALRAWWKKNNPDEEEEEVGCYACREGFFCLAHD